MPKTPSLSRRTFVAGSSLGVAAALAASGCATPGTSGASTARRAREVSSGPTGPFDTMREMIEALDARGRLFRIDRVDQDAYEATALMYRLVERHGLEGAPAVLFDEVKIGGQWLKGPVVGNYLGPWDAECLALGLEPDAVQRQGNLPQGPGAPHRSRAEERRPLPGDRAGAGPPRARPCARRSILRGDEIDLTTLPLHAGQPRRRRPLHQHGLGVHRGPEGRREPGHLPLPAEGAAQGRR